MDQVEMLKKASKERAIAVHRDKSDDELRQIIRHNGMAALASDNLVEVASLVGEQQGCNELLRLREQDRAWKETEAELLRRGMERWRTLLSERRKQAILNLPAATSYNGQLVAAVLEDAGCSLTAEEIREWSDDLTAMEDEEYSKLLNALVNEGVLTFTRGVYSVLCLCTPALIPADPMQWANSRCDSISWDGKQFMQEMLRRTEPLSELDWIKLNWMEFQQERVSQEPPFYYRKAQKEISKYVEAGILHKMPVPNSDFNYYYFAMLGEKGEA